MDRSLPCILATVVLVLQTAQAQEAPAYVPPVYTPEWSAPGTYPDRIALTFSGDPATSISVTWRTDTAVNMAYAEIAEATAAPRFWRTARRYRAMTTTMDARDIPNAQVISNHHHVTFTGLRPETRYAYRVGDGTVWSEWNHHVTASETSAPFSFLYVGDAQNNILELWSRLIREGYRRAPDARFIVHAGDLVNRAHNDSEWHEWFEAGGWIHRVVPSVPVPGNHEYNEYRPNEEDEHLSIQWPYHFTLPENGPPGLEESAYVVDYQGTRIIGMNSNLDYAKQAAWVDSVLAASPHPWNIVTFHHPLFSASVGRDNERLRALWKPIFDRHRVDLVLQGHDHSYARGAAAVNVPTGVNVRDRSGTVYVVSVSGGKMYTVKPDGWDGHEDVHRVRAGENTQLFQQISVSGDTLRFASYTATQDLYDAFLLIREPDGLNRLVEQCGHCIPERTHDNTIPYADPVAMDFEPETSTGWDLAAAAPFMTYVSDAARHGDHAARFELRDGVRAAFATDTYDAPPARTTWYGFSTYIPSPWQASTPVTLAYWEGSPDSDAERSRPPALSVRVRDGSLYLTGHAESALDGGAASVRPVSIPLDRALLRPGAWNDLVFRIKWMYDERGRVQVWLNSEEVAAYEGAIGFNDSDGPVFKLGLGLPSVAGETGAPGIPFVLHDAYRRGNTRADVDPAGREALIGSTQALPERK